jgi:perosamine synthetase
VSAHLIPITRPVTGEAEVEAARRPLLSGWLTQGPEVAAFEREFAEYVGAPHACAVGNCTQALHLALIAIGTGLGDEIITVSHSFIATANAIRYCGAVPVFVDIDPNTFNIDSRLIENAISPRTRAILCVHQVGMPSDMDAILTIARQYGLRVIEDAACAIGSEIRVNGAWERIGRPHGDIACFSFHPRKVITTGDGGMITTANAEWDKRFRRLRQHAMDVPDVVRHGSARVIFESYPELGFNYRLTDLQAAVGREQLKRLPEILARRRLLAARYDSLLAGMPGVRTPHEPEWARSNWQSYCVRLDDGHSQIEVMQALLDEGVASRRGIMCAHRELAYAEEEPWSCGEGPGECGCAVNTCRRLIESERAQDHTILLPLFPQLTDEEQDRVVACLAKALAAQPVAHVV